MRGSYFETPNAFNMGGDETPNLGRGERSKKKRRFRSLSPVAKAQTPAEGVNGIGSAWGGADNKLADWEKQTWRCKWCLVWGSAVWAVRDGPTGPRVSTSDLSLSCDLLTLDRLFATIVGCCMNGTRFCLSGRKSYTSMMYQSADDLMRFTAFFFIISDISDFWAIVKSYLNPAYRLFGKARKSFRNGSTSAPAAENRTEILSSMRTILSTTCLELRKLVRSTSEASRKGRELRVQHITRSRVFWLDTHAQASRYRRPLEEPSRWYLHLLNSLKKRREAHDTEAIDGR